MTAPLRDVSHDDEVWDRAATGFARWRTGDASGLEDLVTAMTPVLWQVVRAYRLGPDAAEDVIQATWLALVRGRDDVQEGQAVGRWLIVSARRAAWRTAQRAGRDQAVDPDDLDVFTPAAASAEAQAVADDERARLWAAVGALDERCQRLLRVVAFLPRPDYAALSDDLKMPVGSIGPTRGRCLAKLRAHLGDDFARGEG